MAKRTLGRRCDFEYESCWWAAVDSNHLPPRYQHGALPVELAAHGLGKGCARSEAGEPELYHGHESSLSDRRTGRRGLNQTPPSTGPGYIAGVVSYTEIFDPDLRAGQPLARSTAWLSESALRIE